MSSRDDLRLFLRAHRDELVLSLYLEARPADPARRRDRELRLKQGIAAAREGIAGADRDERDLFERLVSEALERIPTAAEDVPGGGSWACFCSASGPVLTLTLPAGTDTSVHWGLGANVVPYVRAAVPDASLIAQVDREHVRLTRWEDGRFETLLALDADPVSDTGMHTSEAPRVGFHPGTRGRSGADDAQRQRREESERLRHALLHKLATLPGEPLPIVIGGPTEAVAHFLSDLPAPIADRIIRSEALRLEPPQDGLALVREALHALAVRRLGERVSALRDAVHANGLATSGLEQVGRAAERGAIAELVFSDRAWHEHPGEVEALVQRALLDGARIASTGSVSGVDALDGEADGLVAGLRFALSGS